MKDFESNKFTNKPGSSLAASTPATTAAPFFQNASSLQSSLSQTKTTGGSALASTPASQSSALPANVVKQWKAHIAAGNLIAAVKVVANEMAKRGEIDKSIYQVQPTSGGSDTCRSTNTELFIEDSTVSGANTSECDCVSPAPGSIKLANPRMHIHPDLIQYAGLGSKTPQTNAIVLHSLLLHEFRHIRQQFEQCNMPGTVKSSGICTDCNDPGEMDAYLAQIEAGYDKWEIHNAWIRVFVNWDYLSSSQQTVFQKRRQAAEVKVDKLFPKVAWSTNARVQGYQAWCKTLGNKGSPGTCNSFLTSGGALPGGGDIK